MVTLGDFLIEKIKACLTSENIQASKENVKVVYDRYFQSSNALSIEKLVKKLKLKEIA
jgi:hypothetical protein